jgi:preprotein translocase subunit SecF
MSQSTTKTSFLERMYNGEGAFAIVAKRRRWYWIYAILTVVFILVIALRGFTLGIDFEGGTKMSMPPASGATETSVAQTFEDATAWPRRRRRPSAPATRRSSRSPRSRCPDDQIREARQALFDKYHPVDNTGQPSPDAINDSTVSESWGSSMTQRMLIGMAVFLVLVFAYISIRLERDMAVSAIVTLILDGLFVAGVYSIVGFEVSPATVIGLLTILAYSLYDTVIVFDKVHENTEDVLSSTRSTYGEQVNLAVNQTIMRSLNTSLFSVIPIAALLVIAVWLMGVGTLKDLALVQLAGVIAGTFSSIYFSAPLLVTMKGWQKKYREHDKRVARARELGIDRVTTTTGTEPEPATVPAAAEQTPAPDETGTTGTAGTTSASDDAPQKRTVSRPSAPEGDAGRSWRPGM